MAKIAMFRRNDRGFTLIELLIVVTIIGIITVPLSNVVIGYFQNTDATTARLNESHDAQIAAVYLGRDVASVGTRATASPYALNQSVETGVAYNGGLYPCGLAGTPAATVRFAWDDYSSGPTATIVRVAYVVETVSGQTQLHRIRCDGSSTPVSDVVVAHDLDPMTLPVITCPTTTAECTASVPSSVALTLTMKDPKDTGSAYIVKLTGQRRQT